MNVQQVQTLTGDNLFLNGHFFSGSKNKVAVVFVHGYMTDFYSHQFYHGIQEELQKSEVTYIFGQLRGTGIHTEFINKDKGGKCIGSNYEKLEEAHLDISAWIEFLKSQGYKKIVLVGHSLGTHKVVRYLFEGKHTKNIKKLILLAPFDKNAFIESYTKGKWSDYLKTSEEQITNGREEDIIPTNYDDAPLTYRTYLSWYKKDDLNRIWDFYRTDYISPILSKIEIPIKIVVGKDDPFYYIPEFTKDSSEVEKWLRRSIKNLQVKIIDDCNHTFVGFEELVGREVVEFID